jgi:predicted TIM-barrel fold metal-dependent hydrolase
LTHITPDGTWMGQDRHDARLERLLEELDRCASSRACLVAIAGLIDNETVLRAAHQYPDRFVPIGSLNPVACDSEKEIGRKVADLAAEGFEGLKLHPRLNAYDPLDDKVVAAIRAAADQNLVVFLDTLFRQPGRATRAAADVVDALAVRCPAASIVLLHGGGSQVLAMSEVVAAHPNLTLDISFTVLRYAGSSVDDDLRFLLRTFDRRMVVGSDFPEYLPLETRTRIETLAAGIDAAKRENVLGGNLSRLFAGRTRPRP